MIKIFLVDDQETLLKGLKMRLALEDDLQVVGVAREGFMALQMISQVRPDIVILDIEMPKMDGIHLAEALHELAPEIIVIMLSLHGDPAVKKRASEAGAWAYVEKRSDAANLVEAIRRGYESRNSGA